MHITYIQGVQRKAGGDVTTTHAKTQCGESLECHEFRAATRCSDESPTSPISPMWLPQRLSALDDEVVAHHIVRRLGGEVDNRSLNVGHLAKAADGHIIDPLLGKRFERGVIPDERGVDDPRRDAVYDDAAARPLASHGLCELDDRRLRGVVGGLLLWVRHNERGHRSGVDDLAAARLE